MVKFKTYQIVSLIRHIRIQEKIHGRYIGRSIGIVCLKGVGMKDLYMPFLKAFNEGNKLMQEVYPEVLQKLIIINPPGLRFPGSSC